MVVTTKAYKLSRASYIKLGLYSTLRQQWWVIALAAGVVGTTFFVRSLWLVILPTVALGIYIGFWAIQFYGVTFLEQNRMLFERLSYEISSLHILIKVNRKQGMPILWTQCQRAFHTKHYFLLVVSRAHLIYLPHKAFQGPNAIKFVETLLKRKKLL